MRRASPRSTTCRLSTAAASVAAVVALVGCGADPNVAPPTTASVPDTVALGAFPDVGSSDTEGTVPAPTVAPPTTEPPPTTVEPVDPITAPIGAAIDGNRILLIGDTVIASTAPRHDGAMCDVLEAFGWQAEIAAEFGRFIDFGQIAADARLGPGSGVIDFQVVAVMFGNHFDGDVEGFGAAYDALIASLDGRPTIVYTIAEDDPEDAALNDVIRAIPTEHPNVLIVDWGRIVAAEPDALVADTPSGLTDEGLSRFALFTAAALGEPGVVPEVPDRLGDSDDPTGTITDSTPPDTTRPDTTPTSPVTTVEPIQRPTGCVDPVFTDDSAIVL